MYLSLTGHESLEDWEIPKPHETKPPMEDCNDQMCEIASTISPIDSSVVTLKPRAISAQLLSPGQSMASYITPILFRLVSFMMDRVVLALSYYAVRVHCGRKDTEETVVVVKFNRPIKNHPKCSACIMSRLGPSFVVNVVHSLVPTWHGKVRQCLHRFKLKRDVRRREPF